MDGNRLAVWRGGVRVGRFDFVWAKEGHAACAGLTAHGNQGGARGMGLEVENKTVLSSADFPSLAEGPIRY